MNPAISNLAEVVNENATAKIDPSLDPFNPANGFNPNGDSHYSEDFKKRYFKAQSDKLNELIDIAVKKRDAIAAGKYRYPDDDEFIFPRGNDARLAELDMSVDCCTIRPERVIHNDGSITTEVYHSVRMPIPKSAETNARFSGTTFLTISSFLSANAVRSKTAYDVDWCSSNNSSPCALPHISAPLLVMAHGRSLFHPRRRDQLRSGGQQGQGVYCGRGRDAWRHAVQGVCRRPVHQFDQEHVRLHGEVDECTLAGEILSPA